MRDFCLEQALAGAPVVTRDGKTVNQLFLFEHAVSNWPLYAEAGGAVLRYTKTGHLNSKDCISCDDLLMASVKREGWVNIYDHEQIHPTKEEAEAAISSSLYVKAVATVKVEWES